MEFDIGELDKTFAGLKERLVALRGASGVWEGRLSSSALSTAVAVFALSLVDEDEHGGLIRNGIEWLVVNQNSDGGWGDTVLSESNISTTMLCWAALSVADGGEWIAGSGERGAFSAERVVQSVEKAEGWLEGFAGSLEASDLALAVERKYGRDRTFSVPILTMCALAGRLGDSEEAWKLIKALPFELAVFPHQFFHLLRLPVVSYALPALIAIGQVHYHYRKPRNPVARLARGLAREKTLKKLEELQPENGGFLEAAPLTGFVTMSLAAAGLKDNVVCRRGVEFLVDSVREDGSWPIDTNLSTWVTTLSVNALAGGNDSAELLDKDDREKILEMLLESQYKERHPYTYAAPGGWGWTALPGAVPDADDTAGALIALKNLAPDDERAAAAASAGIEWLLGLQNSDGGTPTFCRGWTKLPFDRSAPDLTAHALGAFAAWADSVSPSLRGRIERATAEGLGYLQSAQKAGGAWVPLWFGNEDAEYQENPVYGTARVLLGLSSLDSQWSADYEAMAGRAVRWLVSVQNSDGGWGGDEGVASSIEETALAVDALAEATAWAVTKGNEYRITWAQVTNKEFRTPKDLKDGGQCPPYREAAKSEIPSTKSETKSQSESSNDPNEDGAKDRTLREAVAKGAGWLLENAGGDSMKASPIGLYFAKLWYYEDLYPLIFTASALQKVKNL